MIRVAHIQPIATGGKPPETCCVLHSQLLQRSVFDVQCSVFSSRTHHSDPEPNWYIYHSDHLGSSAFLTDASGDPTQHLQYMPFGETFVEQRSATSYYTPYTFSAKERDTETGYSYFGARYYDANISVWLSVDPMADKRASLSPYNYCQWRPIVLVDRMGMEDEPVKYTVRPWDAIMSTIMSFTFSKNNEGHQLSTGNTTVTETRNWGQETRDQQGNLVTRVQNITTTSVNVDRNGVIGKTATTTTVSTVTTIGQDGKEISHSVTNTSTIAYESISSNLKNSARQVSEFIHKRGVSPVQVAAKNNQVQLDQINNTCTDISIALVLASGVAAKTGAGAPVALALLIGSGVTTGTSKVSSLAIETDPSKLRVSTKRLKEL
jgi:RHS repeat-associated protein